jgi:hypothetical protein
MEPFVLAGKAKNVFKIIEIKARVEKQEAILKEKIDTALTAEIDQKRLLAAPCPFDFEVRCNARIRCGDCPIVKKLLNKEHEDG